MHESELIGLIKRRDEKGAALLLRRYAPLMRYIIAPILQLFPYDEDAEMPE